MSDKRYQDCNRIEKIWRMRHYIKLPIMWILWKFSKHNNEFNGPTYWELLISMAQIEMKWYYTNEEVMKKIKD
jgi:hypothetical protein